MINIIENQPIFCRIVDNAINNDKISHAYLIAGDESKEAVNYLVKKILCQTKSACNECIICKKIDDNNHLDIMNFDGDVESIKKSNIESIVSNFQKSPVEGFYKVYIIENVEKSSLSSLNSLLKFLEEPEGNTVAVFTTLNKASVLSTILSRCQVIDLLPMNLDKCINHYVSLGYELATANLIAHIIGYRKSIDNDLIDCLDYLYLQAINTVEDIYLRRGNLLINTHLNLLKNKKDKKEIKIFLKILILILKDLIRFSNNLELIFNEKKSFYGSLSINVIDALEDLNLILEAQNKLEGNADVLLLIDSLMSSL